MQAFLAFFAAAVTVFAVSSASAQPASGMGRMPCHSYDELSNQLDQRYKEAPISIGIQSNGNMLQVFASEALDSWTILSVTPQGLGCIIAAGRNWQAMKPDFVEGPET